MKQFITSIVIMIIGLIFVYGCSVGVSYYLLKYSGFEYDMQRYYERFGVK